MKQFLKLDFSENEVINRYVQIDTVEVLRKCRGLHLLFRYPNITDFI